MTPLSRLWAGPGPGGALRSAAKARAAGPTCGATWPRSRRGSRRPLALGSRCTATTPTRSRWACSPPGRSARARCCLPRASPARCARSPPTCAGFVLDGADAPERLEGRPCWPPLAGRGPRGAARRARPRAPLARAVHVGHHRRGAACPEGGASSRRRGRGARAALRRAARRRRAHARHRSPQHLYGLLFRVLWPLAAGRPFLRTPLLHPEELAPHMDEADFALVSTPVALRQLAERGARLARSALPRGLLVGRTARGRGGPAAWPRRSARALRGLRLHRDGRRRGAPAVARRRGVAAAARRRRAGRSRDGRLVVTSPFVSCGEPVGAGRTRLPTGDRAEAAPDGGFWLLGRVDRVIKIGEKRLSLPDMESRLREHPAVEDAALVLLDDGPGEPRVAAVVVPSAAGRARFEAGGRRALGRDALRAPRARLRARAAAARVARGRRAAAQRAGQDLGGRAACARQ